MRPRVSLINPWRNAPECGIIRRERNQKLKKNDPGAPAELPFPGSFAYTQTEALWAVNLTGKRRKSPWKKKKKN